MHRVECKKNNFIYLAEQLSMLSFLKRNILILIKWTIIQLYLYKYHVRLISKGSLNILPPRSFSKYMVPTHIDAHMH